MKRIAIIGAGVSGLSAAQLLKKNHEVTIYERDDIPGGLIKCRRVAGSLFHTCGGHVFNSKDENVLKWFWNIFSRDDEFSKANRNSVILMQEGNKIPYPIENHIYFFNEEVQRACIKDLLFISKEGTLKTDNFEDFLKSRFGKTLYNLYFKPYNEKVWKNSLRTIPLTWLKGKLPMPTVEEILYNNFNHIEEKQFVHSTFWYEKEDGSQFIANTLAKGLNIKYNSQIDKIYFIKGKWYIGKETYDNVIFCGNIKQLPTLLNGIDLNKYNHEIDSLKYHGTTAVFCEIDKNPYSWIYLPSSSYQSHRIICTGNFSNTNNAPSISDNRITGTVEFTDEISKEEIIESLEKMPLHPKYLDHQYNKYTYPIQDNATRDTVSKLKKELAKYGFYFTGRFADWEYYNMDAAISAAMKTINLINADQ